MPRRGDVNRRKFKSNIAFRYLRKFKHKQKSNSIDHRTHSSTRYWFAPFKPNGKMYSKWSLYTIGNSRHSTAWVFVKRFIHAHPWSMCDVDILPQGYLCWCQEYYRLPLKGIIPKIPFQLHVKTDILEGQAYIGSLVITKVDGRSHTAILWMFLDVFTLWERLRIRYNNISTVHNSC